MKKVISNKPPSESVVVADVQENKFYGVVINALYRGFITREKYYDGAFVVRSTDMLTVGNGWDAWSALSLNQVISYLLSDKKQVYEFDSFKELMDWVVEK